MSEPSPEGSTRRRRSWARADKIAIFAVVISAIVTVGIWLADRQGGIVPPSGSITNIADELVVRKEALFVEGKAQDIPAGSEVWLVIRAGSEGRWYPVMATRVGPDGSWRSDDDASDPRNVRLATNGPYYIQIYHADMNAIAEFQQYKAKTITSGIYPGMDKPPGSATLLDQKLIRRDGQVKSPQGLSPLFP
ncbi:hypothetical protein [Spongiactinospora rosea]|nr:hypothetical protein [Spongiactinospora rosea]